MVHVLLHRYVENTIHQAVCERAIMTVVKKWSLMRINLIVPR